MEKPNIHIGDVIKMKKNHPCGANDWTVIRTGADIKLRCNGCQHIVMLDYSDFLKRFSKIITKTQKGSDSYGSTNHS